MATHHFAEHLCVSLAGCLQGPGGHVLPSTPFDEIRDGDALGPTNSVTPNTTVSLTESLHYPKLERFKMFQALKILKVSKSSRSWGTSSWCFALTGPRKKKQKDLWPPGEQRRGRDSKCASLVAAPAAIAAPPNPPWETPARPTRNHRLHLSLLFWLQRHKHDTNNPAASGQNLCSCCHLIIQLVRPATLSLMAPPWGCTQLKCAAQRTTLVARDLASRQKSVSLMGWNVPFLLRKKMSMSLLLKKTKLQHKKSRNVLFSFGGKCSAKGPHHRRQGLGSSARPPAGHVGADPGQLWVAPIQLMVKLVCDAESRRKRESFATWHCQGARGQRVPNGKGIRLGSLATRMFNDPKKPA